MPLPPVAIITKTAAAGSVVVSSTSVMNVASGMLLLEMISQWRARDTIDVGMMLRTRVVKPRTVGASTRCEKGSSRSAIARRSVASARTRSCMTLRRRISQSAKRSTAPNTVTEVKNAIPVP